MAALTPNSEKLNLLIVDDDAMLRTSLAAIFTQFGYDVATASDGFGGLAQMRQQRPDLLLSDLHMPGMSGFEFLSVVRRRFPGIHAIAMSSAHPGKGVPDGVAADGYYEKASNIGELLEQVETAARHERAVRDETAREAGREFVRNFIRHANGQPPVWVATNGNEREGETYVTLTCPQCLRSFPHVLLRPQTQGRRDVHRAGCSHCSSVMDFAVVALPNGAGNAMPEEAIEARAEGEGLEPEAGFVPSRMRVQ